MRSYTNKEGDLIAVSKDHLDTAVKIKKELQNLSPSRKCSWAKLVNMMEQEGYFDAENSESYRCMVKAYQKSIGELPEVTKYADMVSTSKLQSIKDAVGEMAYEKRENQHVLRNLNKVKRDIIDTSLIAEEIGIAFKNHDFSSFIVEPKPIKVGSTRMVASLSDIHIGALVETSYNNYNYEIAKQRISKYASAIIREAKANEVSHIDIVNLGDVIEHSNMRFGQAYNVEFPFSKQIVLATDLIIKFLVSLHNEGFILTYAGIAGNHDRITDKDKNIDGDHAVNAINYGIQSFIENSGIENLTFIESDDYSHSFSINGVNIKAIHGDLDSKDNKNLLGNYSTLDGINYDLILMGHYHTSEIRELGYNKYLSLCGSTKGADEYSINKIKKMSSASQNIHLIDENGDIRIITIKLN